MREEESIAGERERETWGRRREEGGPGVKRVNKVERRAEDADGDKKRNVVFYCSLIFMFGTGSTSCKKKKKKNLAG